MTQQCHYAVMLPILNQNHYIFLIYDTAHNVAPALVLDSSTSPASRADIGHIVASIVARVDNEGFVPHIVTLAIGHMRSLRRGVLLGVPSSSGRGRRSCGGRPLRPGGKLHGQFRHQRHVRASQLGCQREERDDGNDGIIDI